MNMAKAASYNEVGMVLVCSKCKTVFQTHLVFGSRRDTFTADGIEGHACNIKVKP